MGKEIGLGRLTLLYAVGNLFSRAIGFGMFFLYTYFITKEDIGYFDIITTTVSLLTPLISLQIYDAVVRWLLNLNDIVNVPNYKSKIISASLILIFLSILLFSIGYWGMFIFFSIKNELLVYLMFIGQTLYSLFPQLARGLNLNVTFAVSGVIYSLVFALVTIIGLVVFRSGIEGLLIANILASFISVLFLWFRLDIYKYLSIRSIDYGLAKDMIYFSLPLIPNTLGWWVISVVNRYVIVYNWGNATNGQFAVALKFPSILLMLTSIFGLAWTEKSVLSYGKEDTNSYYTEVFSKYFSLLFGFIIALISVSKLFVKYLVQNAYYEIWRLMPILFLAVGFQALSSFYGTGYISSKNTKGAFSTTVYGAVTAIVLSYLSIPTLELFGASISVCLGFLVMLIVRIFQTKKFFKIVVPWKLVLFSIIGFIVVSYLNYSENLIVLYVNSFVGILFFCYMNRLFVVNLYNTFLNKFIKLN